MTKLQTQTGVTNSTFVGKSAKDVRELVRTNPDMQEEALAYAKSKQAKLAGHKFRGKLWAETVRILEGGKPVAKKAHAKKSTESAEIVALRKQNELLLAIVAKLELTA